MSETTTHNTHYPWLQFTLHVRAHVLSETRRCLRCGAEETEEAVERTFHYGSHGVAGMEAFVRRHYRCEEKKDV